jgi:hypothetical protein
MAAALAGCGPSWRSTGGIGGGVSGVVAPGGEVTPAITAENFLGYRLDEHFTAGVHSSLSFRNFDTVARGVL